MDNRRSIGSRSDIILIQECNMNADHPFYLSRSQEWEVYLNHDPNSLTSAGTLILISRAFQLPTSSRSVLR